MASELSLLIPEFRKKVIDVIAACKKRGVNIEVLETVISPLEQASLWKQGRTAIEAELKMLALENANAHYLSQVMRAAQAKETNKVTEALPGYSWHQWGEAVSCVWVDRINKLCWSPTKLEGKMNGYKVYGEEAQNLGLTHGSSFDDVAHGWTVLQLRPVQSPTEIFSLIEIDAEMKKRFLR